MLNTIIGWPAPDQAEHRQGPRLGARRRGGRGHQAAARLRPGRRPSRSPTRSSRTPARSSTAAPQLHADWQPAYDAWRADNPERAALLDRLLAQELPDGWADALPTFAADPKGIATRAASGKVLDGAGAGAARAVGRLGRPGREQQHDDGGRAELDPDQPADQGLVRRPLRPDACTSASASTPWARSSAASRCSRLTRPYGGTFLCFSDYMRPAVRIAALMQLPAIYVWTHDSIGLGEDGPTHQPVEHLAALRAIPGLDVVRPADANETAVAWRTILEHNDRPGRAGPVPAEPADRGPDRRVARVGRRRRPGRLRPGRGRRRHAAGDHRQHRLRGADRPGRPNSRCRTAGSPTRVVSMPCREWFVEQDQAYRDEVLPAGDQGPGQHRGRRRPRAGATSSATPAASSASSTTARPPTRPRSTASSASPPDAVAAGRRAASPAIASDRQQREHTHDRPPGPAQRRRASPSGSTTSPASGIASGSLQKLIDDKHVVGVTTNPSIFAAALTNGAAYDEQVARARRQGRRRRPTPSSRSPPRTSAQACDIFRPTCEATGHQDGKVSIEVEPGPGPRHRRHGRPGQAAVRRRRPAERLHQDPGDPRGPAGDHPHARRGHQRQRHADLLPRPLPRRDERLPHRAGAGPRGRPRPVRDPLGRVVLRLPRRHRDRPAADRHRHRRGQRAQGQGRRRQRPAGLPGLRGGLLDRRAGRSWPARAPRPQRPLWASTGVKDPAYPDTLYVTELVAPRHRQHDAGEDPRRGRRPRRDHRRHDHRRTTTTRPRCSTTWPRSASSYQDVVETLETEGVVKFEKSWSELLDRRPVPAQRRRQGRPVSAGHRSTSRSSPDQAAYDAVLDAARRATRSPAG